METLAVVATKGGVGKTTLAVHLAVAAQREGLRVLLIDLDPQGSAAQWGRDRDRWVKNKGQWFKHPIEVQRPYPNALDEALEQARGEGFDLAIIDTPPHADVPAVAAVSAADLVLVPTRPGYFDLHAAKATIALVRDRNVPAFFVVNQVPHNNMRIADDAATFLISKGLQQAPVIITALQPYVRALRDGLTAPELVEGGRHEQEIGALWAFLKEECARLAKDGPAKRPRGEAPMPMGGLLEDPFAEIMRRMRGDAA